MNEFNQQAYDKLKQNESVQKVWRKIAVSPVVALARSLAKNSMSKEDRTDLLETMIEKTPNIAISRAIIFDVMHNSPAWGIPADSLDAEVDNLFAHYVATSTVASMFGKTN